MSELWDQTQILPFWQLSIASTGRIKALLVSFIKINLTYWIPFLFVKEKCIPKLWLNAVLFYTEVIIHFQNSHILTISFKNTVCGCSSAAHSSLSQCKSFLQIFDGSHIWVSITLFIPWCVGFYCLGPCGIVLRVIDDSLKQLWPDRVLAENAFSV